MMCNVRLMDNKNIIPVGNASFFVATGNKSNIYSYIYINIYILIFNIFKNILKYFFSLDFIRYLISIFSEIDFSGRNAFSCLRKTTNAIATKKTELK